MNSLANHVLGKETSSEVEAEKDVFAQQSSVGEETLQEYHFRNERKKQDEKWLKVNKGLILKGLQELGKRKADWGGFRASYSTPDKSNFDMEKVKEFLEANLPYKVVESIIEVRKVVNEGVLSEYIERGEIDLEALKAHAWIEKYDAPRLIVSAVKG
ncbi:hypothetical protein P4V86_03755 [Brevibacillus laterosporus]|uniref:hypothetical protein n=1 Tax=Brevibacillus laterosporus TaxID=1465 RepID=UPI000380CFBA|nr:hypothetical protein [Brevibacillus laterosporus]ATO48633.1 hypothetical protein BrL25_05575 [Brevibacillus laterosporus DSM 25]MED2002474.1 hypothetical protein [Brevibacillus laterosporus]